MKNPILELISQHGECTPKELSDSTGISRQYLHRQLNQLSKEGLICKIGTSPLTFYRLSEPASTTKPIELLDSLQKTIASHFLQITPSGRLLEGMEAFTYWCAQRKLPLQKSALEYEMHIKRHERYKSSNHCIEATDHLESTMGYGKIQLNQLLLLDYQELDQFGKTKLAHLLYYAKHSQHRGLAQRVVDLVKDRVKHLLSKLAIDAIAFVPPTQKRDVQIMKLLEQQLSFNLPIVPLIKVRGDIAVPQSALTRLADKIENANSSILCQDKRQFGNLLLIDDEVVSGASLNETARKLKKRNIAKAVYGIGLIGSQRAYKG